MEHTAQVSCEGRSDLTSFVAALESPRTEQKAKINDHPSERIDLEGLDLPLEFKGLVIRS